MSPMSPANMTSLSQRAQTLTFFPPELLAISFGQGANGHIDPLDRQLVFGGYSLDANAGLAGGQDMMSGIDSDTVASGAQQDGGLQGWRSGLKTSTNGRPAGLADGAGGLGGPEASFAWFMPFNVEPPDMGHNPGFNVGGIDPFSGVFRRGGSGLATLIALGGDMTVRGPNVKIRLLFATGSGSYRT